MDVRRQERIRYDLSANVAYMPVGRDSSEAGDPERVADILDPKHPGDIALDFDAGGHLIGVEILEARTLLRPVTLSEARWIGVETDPPVTQESSIGVNQVDADPFGLADDVRQRRLVYDPEADAAYLAVGRDAQSGESDTQIYGISDPRKLGEIILGFDTEGHLIGIEMLGARALLRAHTLEESRRYAPMEISDLPDFSDL